ncbi:MAG: cupin-like domain-containing protein [Bacteroidetes bacterium]|nr:MAG: cupin-like domain-containing protein [Bacteroidota bacterium]
MPDSDAAQPSCATLEWSLILAPKNLLYCLMPIDLSLPIDRVSGITREAFQKNYMRPQRPVIIRHFFGPDAPIYSKWTFEYFKRELGHIQVGVYDVEGKTRQDDRSYKQPEAYMNFGDYLDLIQQGATTKRLFLFNIFKHKKELRQDFHFPNLADKVFHRLPLAFFGGPGAITRIHQDMDMSNVFLTEVVGRKRVVLFDPKYSALLYRYPFGVHSSIDVNHPDYKRYPALQKVKGYEFFLEAGDTVFMPSGWWHHIEYHAPSIGMAMRSLSPYWSTRMRGLANVAVLTHVDDLLRKVLQERWYQFKTRVADQRAAAAMSE